MSKTIPPTQTVRRLDPAFVRLTQSLLKIIERLEAMATYNTAALDAAKTALVAAVTATLAGGVSGAPDQAAQDIIDQTAKDIAAQTERLTPAVTPPVVTPSVSSFPATGLTASGNPIHPTV